MTSKITHIVNFSCGHMGLISSYGNDVDVQNKIDWLESEGQCHHCHEGRALEIESRAIEWMLGGVLPELEGTEKQIIYADNIRHDFAYDMSLYIGEYLPDLTRDEKGAFRRAFNEATKASFWIKRRGVFRDFNPSAMLALDENAGAKSGILHMMSETV